MDDGIVDVNVVLLQLPLFPPQTVIYEASVTTY